MTSIVEKVRNLITDNLKTDGRDVYTYEASTSSKIFTLTESNIEASTIVVYKNGTVWSSANYSYSTTTGKLTVTGTLSAGDSLEVFYSYYAKYSNNELDGFVKGAIYYISVNGYKTFVVESGDILSPVPTEAEENLIAIIAHILIKGNIVSYRTPELTITFERGDSIEKKITKFIRQCGKAYGVLEYIDLRAVVAVEEEDL